MGVRGNLRVLGNERMLKTTFEKINDIEYIHQDSHREIFERLRKAFAGFDLMLVGGYNRDLVRGELPHDLDFATNARPEEIVKMLQEVADRNTKGESSVWELGAKFGTIAAKLNGEDIEITTYRVNETYADDSRHPEVEWGDTFEEDSARRDFTINAIGYDIMRDELVDCHGGIADIKAGLIRTVGDPEARFTEDPLRILRAARFAAKLGYGIEEKTYKAMKHCAPLIAQLSEERKRDEMDKILATERPQLGVDILVNSYGMEYIIPEIMDTIGMEQPTQFHDKDVYGHTLRVVENVVNEPRLRWAALLHDIGKPNTYSINETGRIHYFGHQNEGARMAKEILQRLKFPKEDTDAICHLIRQHMYAHSLTKGLRSQGIDESKVTRAGGDGTVSDKTLKKFVNNLDYWKNVNGEDILLVSAEDVMKLNRADILGAAPGRVAAGLRNFDKTKGMVELIRAQQNGTKPRLPVDGNDLMKKFDLKPGPDLGAVLGYLTEKMRDGELGESDTDRAYKLTKGYLKSSLGYKFEESPVNGDVLMQRFGIAPGPQIGALLGYLKEQVKSKKLDYSDQDAAFAAAEKYLRRNKII
jgi:poly(A) polymerase